MTGQDAQNDIPATAPPPHWADRYVWLLLLAFLSAILFWWQVIGAIINGQSDQTDRAGALRVSGFFVLLAIWLWRINRRILASPSRH